LNQFRPDAVISYWAHPEGEVGLLAAREAGVPSVVIVGGTDVLLLPHEPGRGAVIRRVLRESSAVVGISEGLRQATIGLGIPAEQAHTIYQGIDPAVFHNGHRAASRENCGIPPHCKLLLWVGRMVPIKGLEMLINSFAELRVQRKDVHLALLGDGPSRPAIEQLVREQGLTEHVTFAGSVGHNRIADWYRAADATVLSSHSEGLPNVLRESLACGTPFVTTDVGSVREIADERYSRVVPVRNTQAFTEALIAILHPEFATAAQFRPRTWQDTARELTSLLQTLVQRREQGTRKFVREAVLSPACGVNT
jgi:glycosyltransferase involved in cell wall biosynthesis